MTETDAIKQIQYRIATATAVVGTGNNTDAFADLQMAIQALRYMQQRTSLKNDLKNELKQAIENGTIVITYGNEKLFEIIDTAFN